MESQREIYILYPSTAEVPALCSLDTTFYVPRSLWLIFKSLKITNYTKSGPDRYFQGLQSIAGPIRLAR